MHSGSYDTRQPRGLAFSSHLAYAKRLREACFSEQQAQGQAEALAAAMSDSLATKQDLNELKGQLDARFAGIDTRFAGIDARFEYLEKHFDTRLAELEKRIEIRLTEQESRVEVRFGEQTARFDGRCSDLERRLTARLGGIMIAGVGAVSALVTLL